MPRTISIPEQFSLLKAEAQQSYELARTAAAPGKKLSLTGALGADADYHIADQTSFLRMVAFVRMMERNDPIISSAARRLRDNVNVGQMTPTPDTGSEILDEHLKGLWKEFASDADECDATRRFNFEAMADIAYVRTIFDGDIFPVPREDGRIQNLEAHRCQTPNLSRLDRGVCGVLTDEVGEVTTYFLTRRSTGYGKTVRVADVEPIPARNSEGWKNVFHTYQPSRFSLNRGITSLAPVGTTASRRDDLEFATILKAQVASCVTFLEKITDAELYKLMVGSGKDLAAPIMNTFEGTDDAGFAMRTAAIHPGRVLEARPGRELTMQNPNIPGEGQLQLNDLLIEYMAMCLDLPSIVLRLDAKNANFSQFRNVLDQARATYGKHQRWFSSMYHRPIYRNLLRVRAPRDSVIRDFIRAEKVTDLRKSRLFRHEWNAVGWKYPHPVDDATGDLILLANSMQSLEQYSRQRYGYGAAELIKSVVKHNGAAIRAAITESAAIEKETGRKVDWQYLFPIPNRNGMNIQLIDQPDSEIATTTVPPADAAATGGNQ